MLAALKSSIGYRQALKAVRQRTAPPWPDRPQDRKLLVLLPYEEEDTRAAWGLIKTLDIPTSHVIPVSLSDAVPYVPDAYAGAVFKVEEKLRDWRGIPKRIITDAIWTQRPHVALDLSPGFDLGAAYLVGASTAQFRIGLFSEEGEPFYDFMIAESAGYASAIAAMRQHLTAILPPVLAFEEAA